MAHSFQSVLLGMLTKNISLVLTLCLNSQWTQRITLPAWAYKMNTSLKGHVLYLREDVSEQ